MKFKTLSGREVNVNFSANDYPILDTEHAKSNLQYYFGQEIKKFFPREVILEEFIIPDSQMRLDFFIPLLKLAFEIQGEQHYKFNIFFFSSKRDFIKAQSRDSEKKRFCDLNNIRLIYLHEGDNLSSKLKEV